jgi:hypothetical protein
LNGREAHDPLCQRGLPVAATSEFGSKVWFLVLRSKFTQRSCWLRVEWWCFLQSGRATGKKIILSTLVTMAPPGHLIARVFQWLANEVIVKSLANSPAFQQFAVRTAAQARAASRQAADVARAMSKSSSVLRPAAQRRRGRPRPRARLRRRPPRRARAGRQARPRRPPGRLAAATTTPATTLAAAARVLSSGLCLYCCTTPHLCHAPTHTLLFCRWGMRRTELNQ